MRLTTVIGALLTGAFGACLLAAPQDQAAKPAIDQQLRKQYAAARVGSNGVVTQPGSVLVIQEDGIKAVPASYQGYFANSVKKGARIKPNIIQHIGGGGTGLHAAYLEEARLLQVGEKAYVTKVEIDKDTEIIFSLQSCGSCDPAAVDSNNPPFRASLAFQFAKGYLAAADWKDVQETIGQVFAIADAASSQSSAPAATSQPSQAASVPAAPPEPAEPPAIALGQTTDQVVTSMGQPERKAKVGTKEIYFYKDMKITFVDGKVSDVE